jgi:thiosulfate/3-mercaptopyruvate sulfurtransferase
MLRIPVVFLAGICVAAAQQGAAVREAMLVEPAWLAGRLGDPALVVLHVGSARDYEAGHVPGARLIALNDISTTGERGLRLELPPAAALREAFGRLGVADNSRIVVYAGTDSVQSATRVWFTLDYLGLGDRAALLDGGLRLWRGQGRAVSTATPPPAAPGRLTAAGRPQVVVDADWVRAHLPNDGVAVLDARLPQFYTGAEAGAMPRAGHIPGARNVPYSSAFDEQGKLKPPAALREAMGEPRSVKVAYCHIGQQATVLYFVARYLGMEARLYDGSFQDWSGRPELPVETGK